MAGQPQTPPPHGTDRRYQWDLRYPADYQRLIYEEHQWMLVEKELAS